MPYKGVSSLRPTCLWLSSTVLLSLLALRLLTTPQVAPPVRPSGPPDYASQKSVVVEAYGKLPLAFEANRGQTHESVQFLSRGSGYTMFLTNEDLTLSLRKPASDGIAAVLHMKLVGANPSPEIIGEDELPGKSNYFIGNDPEKWRTNVPHYTKVSYKEVYPGIDLVYYGNQRQLEYDFVVAPGADPRVIALDFAGADRREVDKRGDLVLGLGEEEVRFQKPLVYQEENGRRRLVAGSYALNPASPVSFELASYDRTRPLIIDPVLVYSTYLGGASADVGEGIAVDASGIYVSGSTQSIDFPTSTGAFNTSFNGGSDIFVAKLNLTGSALLYSTYVGGSGTEEGGTLAVDSSNNAYVTGTTKSTNFPVENAFQEFFAGGAIRGDAVLFKLNSGGDDLLYSTYLGGSGEEQGFGIAVDSNGNAYITGNTGSANFPKQVSFQNEFGGSGNPQVGDAFVTKFDTWGSVVYSRFLGGTSEDEGRGITVDLSGSAYVTGRTGSTDFPTTSGAFQTIFGGGFDDAFITKLDANAVIVYSTYLGGSGRDEVGHGIAVDSFGNSYVTGGTGSANFPTTTGAFQTVFAGGNFGDCFVAKFNASGSELLYSTYLGGTGGDQGRGIDIDASGNAYVTGLTLSTSDFPTERPLQDTNAGGFDAFVTKLNPTGSTLAYSTYLGGSSTQEEWGASVSVDPPGNAYITGPASSSNFPTANALQSDSIGTHDAFVAKICDPCSPTIAANSPSVAVNEGAAANNTGAYSDQNVDDDVNISGSVGAVIKTGINSGSWDWSLVTTDGPRQSQVVTITADDGNGGIATTDFTLSVINVAPTATFNNDGPVDEGSSFNLSLTDPFDPSSDDTAAGFTYAFDCGDGSGFGGFSTANTASCATNDNASRSVKGRIKDKDGGETEYTASVTVNNVAPVITEVSGPTSPLTLGAAATVVATFTDVGTADTHTCSFAWDDGTTTPPSLPAPTVTETDGSGSCSATHTYGGPGVFTVSVTVTDDDSGSDTSTFEFVVVYDPNGGFVTGGGWINSPAGAYVADPGLTGKASFGFVAKYQPGATVPTGQTEFQFKAGSLNFHSSTYEWLVVAGARAQFKGSGTINGGGNYGFLLTAKDGALPGGGGSDTFRIKIWNINNGGTIVYDNQLGAGDNADPTTTLGGGNIVIHKP